MLSVQLPDSASVGRTREVLNRIEAIARQSEGVAHTVSVSGQSLLLATNASNLGSMYVMLEEFSKRKGVSAEDIAAEIRSACLAEIRDAQISIFGAPPIDGLGTTGGFKLIVEDRGNMGLDELQRVTDKIVDEANSTPGLQGVFGSVRSNTPWLYLDIDREKCLAIGVSPADVFETLQVYLGSYYVNNFNRFGRSWQVNVMADEKYRANVSQILQLKVPNSQKEMVPLATLVRLSDEAGPQSLMRYNMYSASSITGNLVSGTSSGDAIELLEKIAREQLPRSMAFDWTELTYMQLDAGNTAMYVFALAVVFVFLVLAAQYESWSLPLAVILVVPMCLLCSVVGISIAKMDVNIFTQIGLIVLVGLASKNAILIVEFAEQERRSGKSVREATISACRLRLRPILMTSFAFILGVVPLVIAEGAGAEMRRTLGTAVFSGMLGVTFFGILLTPVFYYAIRWFRRAEKTAKTDNDH
jgi:multidrug efflux pump subunit AcrB